MPTELPPPVLRARVAAELAPVRPLPPPWRRALRLAPLLAAPLAVVPVAFGLRVDLPAVGPAFLWTLAAVQVALAAALAGLALVGSVPGRPWARAALAAVAAVGAWLVASIWLTWLRSPTQVPVGQEALYWRLCFGYPVLLGLPALVALTALAARARPLAPLAVGTLGGLAAGLAAEAGWRTFCEVSRPGHIVFAHLLAVAALAALGTLAGAVVAWLQRRAARRP